MNAHKAPRRRRIRQRIEKPMLAELPQTGMLRIQQFVPRFVPIGRSTWWKLVAEGKAPKPVKLSPRVTVWRAEAIRAFIADNFHAESAAA